MILPISYICLKFGCRAHSVFIVHFIMEFFTQIARMVMLRPLLGIRLREYFKNIYYQVFLVFIFSTIAPLLICVNMEDNFLRFILICVTCFLSVGLVTYTLGLDSNERVFVKSKAMNIYKKLFQNK